MKADQVIIKRNFIENNLLTRKNKKIKIMGNILYAIAVILVIAWAVGFVGFHVGGIIHILLVIAVIAVILRIIQGKSIV